MGFVGDRPNCRIVRDKTSQQVIRDSDVVIVVSSSTGAEACIADKPLIVLRLPGIPEVIPYRKYGAAEEIWVDRPDAAQCLNSVIESWRSDPRAARDFTGGTIVASD